MLLIFTLLLIMTIQMSYFTKKARRKAKRRRQRAKEKNKENMRKLKKGFSNMFKKKSKSAKKVTKSAKKVSKSAKKVSKSAKKRKIRRFFRFGRNTRRVARRTTAVAGGITGYNIIKKQIHSNYGKVINEDDLRKNEKLRVTVQGMVRNGDSCMSTDCVGYRGTKTKKNCSAWNTSKYKSLGKHKYCRNPDKDPKGLWCYVNGKKQYC